jgi:predicted ribosome quality control (RQC) complex YloA/Tae2 family protein
MVLGKQADDKRKAALKRNRDFRDIGRRKQFIDKLNAKRQEVAGALAKLPFEHPELPSDYADRFFAREAPRDDEPTIDEIKETILTLEARIAEQRTLLKKLEDEAEAERQAEATRTAQATHDRGA